MPNTTQAAAGKGRSPRDRLALMSDTRVGKRGSGHAQRDGFASSPRLTSTSEQLFAMVHPLPAVIDAARATLPADVPADPEAEAEARGAE